MKHDFEITRLPHLDVYFHIAPKFLHLGHICRYYIVNSYCRSNLAILPLHL